MIVMIVVIVIVKIVVHALPPNIPYELYRSYQGDTFANFARGPDVLSRLKCAITHPFRCHTGTW